jgi:hypothetical protein
MAEKKQGTLPTVESKLTPKERKVCLKIVDLKEGLSSQRAEALLALDKGLMRVEVSKQTGLTNDQIRYLLGRFRQIRLSLFPADVLGKTQPGSAAKSKKSEKARERVKVEVAEEKKKKKKKGKKKNKKKDKKKKKKKDKKSKKSKKAKKNKKKSKK